MPTPQAESAARRLAEDFFILDSLAGDYERAPLAFRVNRSAAESAIAEGILKQLGLKRGQFGLEELIQALARVNISVVFVDFGVQFKVETEAKLNAFCAKRGNKYLIAVDSRRKIEDVVWDIFHELAHIVCGDLDDEDDTDSSEETQEKAQKCSCDRDSDSN